MTETLSRRTEALLKNRALLIRTINVSVAVGLLGVLLLSRWLQPDPRGFGTHEQLYLQPCNFHALTGLPCPSCGMTTAFAHMARGEVLQAFKAQPMGALLFVSSVLLLPISLWETFRGKFFFEKFLRLPWGRLSWVLAALFALSWIYKLLTTIIT